MSLPIKSLACLLALAATAVAAHHMGGGSSLAFERQVIIELIPSEIKSDFEALRRWFASQVPLQPAQATWAEEDGNGDAEGAWSFFGVQPADGREASMAKYWSMLERMALSFSADEAAAGQELLELGYELATIGGSGNQERGSAARAAALLLKIYRSQDCDQTLVDAIRVVRGSLKRLVRPRPNNQVVFYLDLVDQMASWVLARSLQKCTRYLEDQLRFAHDGINPALRRQVESITRAELKAEEMASLAGALDSQLFSLRLNSSEIMEGLRRSAVAQGSHRSRCYGQARVDCLVGLFRQHFYAPCSEYMRPMALANEQLAELDELHSSLQPLNAEHAPDTYVPLAAYWVCRNTISDGQRFMGQYHAERRRLSYKSRNENEFVTLSSDQRLIN